MGDKVVKISVVVPCHNSAEYITQTVNQIYEALPPNSEIILIENGSLDATLEVCKKLSKSLDFPNSKVECIQAPKGLGSALRAGIELSVGEILIFMADDLPFGIQEIIEVEAHSKNIAGNIYAISKYVPESEFYVPFFRKFVSWGFRLLRIALLGLKMRDSQGSFFGDGDLIRKISKTCREDGFLITTEFFATALQRNIRPRELPAGKGSEQIRPTTIKFRDLWIMLVSLYQLRQRILKTWGN